VDTRNERVLLDGVHLARLSDSAYRLILALAQRGGGEPVPSKVTDKAISGARQTEGATRHVVWRIREWVESSFKDAGRRLPEDVKESGLVRAVRRKGRVLTVTAAVT
jgi:hypothetical protein